jgi:hypothetical protein
MLQLPFFLALIGARVNIHHFHLQAIIITTIN